MAVTLVPSSFFKPDAVRGILAGVAELNGSDRVEYVNVPQYGAVMIYSVSGGEEESLPELFHVLGSLPGCPEYNKVVASYGDGYLRLGIAQGQTLLLANEYRAADFTTAQYYIFLAMKSLQLNPEVTTICFRSELGKEDEMSLYRYFKAVDRI